MTVIFLRFFHHGPTPVPQKLRHIVFNIIAPMIFFDVNMDRTSAKISQVLPGKKNLSEKENGQRNLELDSTDHTEKTNVETLLQLLKALKKIAESEDQLYIKEWQMIAKVLDKLLFILNILCMIIAVGYVFTVLYTY